tara:strand:- start:33 stop:3128 length:3096 start_codon:yes stop_codon:yes gene_type:complete
MASIKELQTRLDNKTFNPAELNAAQRDAVDMAFQQGVLKGYSSVSEIEKERRIGEKLIAKEKTEKAQPFTTATKGMIPFASEDRGIKRSDLELIGDVAGAGYVYIKDMPKIIEEFRRDPLQGYGANKYMAAADKFDGFKAIANKLPIVKNVKILNRAARIAGNVADGFRNLSKFPSQLLATEVKSQLVSSAGAGAGSVLYDAANMATDFNGAVLQDLSEVSNNDIKKLPYAQQVFVHGAEAMQNALFYNLIGSSIAPILGTVMRGMKGPLGLGSKESKELAEFAQKKNMEMTIPALAKTGSIGGRIITAYEKIFGVIPIVNTFAKKQRQKFEKQAFEAFIEEVTQKAPIQHVGVMNLQFLPVMRNNFNEFFESIRANYTVVDKLAEKMGNPKIIPTADVKKAATEIMEGFERASLEPFTGKVVKDGARIPEYGAAFKKGSEFGDPFVDTINKLRGIDDYITPTEYQGLMKTIMRDFANSGLDDPLNMFWSMQTSMKNGFNKVGNPAAIDGYLKSPVFKEQYDELIASSGKQTADEFLTKTVNDMKQFGDSLFYANKYFSTTVSAFNSPVAKRLKNSEANIFATKAMAGVLNPGRTGESSMWENAIRNVFTQNDSMAPMAMNQLKFILGVNQGNKAGQELFNRARTNYLWESIIKSFDEQPPGVAKTLGEYINDAKKTGVVDFKGMKDIFKAAGTENLEAVKRFDPEKALRYGLGEIDTQALKATAKDAGQFNIVKFRNNMGYFDSASKQASIAKWTEMYGGGRQGKEAAQNLGKLIDLMEAEYGKVISDSNSYLMRRIMLSGPGQSVIAGGLFAGAAASGGIMGAIPLTFILAAGGYYLANPKSLKFLLDVYTDLERMEKLGRRATPQNVPKSMFKLLNWAAQEDKDFPQVDPKKIDFEEVTDYLLNKDILIPQYGFSVNAINSKLKDRFYPELKTVKEGTNEAAIGGVNYIKGSDEGVNVANQTINFVPPAPNNVSVPNVANTTTPNFGSPAYTKMAPQVFQPQANRKQQFQSLFPNDALSAAIAERGQQ